MVSQTGVQISTRKYHEVVSGETDAEISISPWRRRLRFAHPLLLLPVRSTGSSIISSRRCLDPFIRVLQYLQSKSLCALYRILRLEVLRTIPPPPSPSCLPDGRCFLSRGVGRACIFLSLALLGCASICQNDSSITINRNNANKRPDLLPAARVRRNPGRREKKIRSEARQQSRDTRHSHKQHAATFFHAWYQRQGTVLPACLLLQHEPTPACVMTFCSECTAAGV